MLDLLIPLSCFFFILFFISGKYKSYCGVAAWTFFICSFITGLPEWIEESNIMYPVMVVLSLPFLYITTRLLLKEKSSAYNLTRAAGVAIIIYAPFTFIEEIGSTLIHIVVQHTAFILNMLGYPVDIILWNTFQHGFFRVEIILACTGIQAIAIMLGVAAAVPTTVKQKILAFLLIAPVIYILNLFRNAGVIITYTGQMFTWLPDISGSQEYGFSSFFWAHNIFAEGIALVFLIILAMSLFRLIPELGNFAIALVADYETEIRKIFGKDKLFSG